MHSQHRHTLFKQEIEKLNVKNLKCVLNNLKLTRPAVRRWLGGNSLHSLLQDVPLDRGRKEIITVDPEEKTGHMVRMMHTVVMSFTGLFLGLSDFLGIAITTLPQLLFFGSIALGLGAIAGYMNYESVSQEEKENIEEQKLSQARLQVAEALLSKRKASIQASTAQIKQILSSLKIDTIPLGEMEQEEDVTNIKEEISKMVNGKLAENSLLQKEDFLYFVEVKEKSEEKSNLKEYSNKLTQPYNRPSQTLMSGPRWAWTHKMNIFLAVLPTLVGTASSFFIILNAIPEVLKKIGYPYFYSLLGKAMAKAFSIFIILGVTLYFVMSHIKSHRKSYLREKKLEIDSKELAKKELEFSKSSDTYQKLKRLQQELEAFSKIANVHRFYSTGADTRGSTAALQMRYIS